MLADTDMAARLEFNLGANWLKMESHSVTFSMPDNVINAEGQFVINLGGQDSPIYLDVVFLL